MTEPSASTEKKSLVVHLQVWHYRASEGRSIDANNAFGDLFRNVPDWEVIATEFYAVASLNSHDRYVPVEVRFRHRTLEYDHPGEAAMAAVRRLFFKTAPQFVYQFCISNRSTPHNLNIHPVDVPKSFRSRYTHVYGLNPLHIRINTFLLPDRLRVDEGEDEVQSWLRSAGNGNTADDILGTLAIAVSLYLVYHYRQNAGKGRVNGQPDVDMVNDYLSGVYLPEELGGLRSLLRKLRAAGGNYASHPEAPTTDVQLALKGAGQLLTEYEHLADLVKGRSRRLEEDQVLSCQDLHELVQDAHTVTLQVSRLNQAVRPMIKLLEAGYKDVIEDSKSYVDAVGIVGYIGLTLRYITGRSTEDDARYRMWVARGAEAMDKKTRVRDFDIEIKKLVRDVRQAQGAISDVFCAQVMNVQLDDDALPEHERRRILATLGVDMEAVSDPVYGQELVRHRIGTFLSQDGVLRRSMEKVMEDVHLGRD